MIRLPPSYNPLPPSKNSPILFASKTIVCGIFTSDSILEMASWLNSHLGLAVMVHVLCSVRFMFEHGVSTNLDEPECCATKSVGSVSVSSTQAAIAST